MTKLRLTAITTIAILLVVSLLSSKNTGARYPMGVKYTLRSAGPNRPELERVLEHYRSAGDAERYRAACFLIGNMRGRYTGLAFD